MLVMHGVPSCWPKYWPMWREAMQCSIQKLRIALIGMRQREVVFRLGMREAGRIEVEAVLIRLRPVDPRAEMFRLQFVAIDLAPAGFRIHRVQIQAMLARQQAVHLIEIAAQLIGRARLAGIVARGRDAAAEAAVEILEAAHIVALPAVQADAARSLSVCSA